MNEHLAKSLKLGEQNVLFYTVFVFYFFVLSFYGSYQLYHTQNLFEVCESLELYFIITVKLYAPNN